MQGVKTTGATILQKETRGNWITREATGMNEQTNNFKNWNIVAANKTVQDATEN